MFQPSSFQFAFTAQGTLVRHTISATTHRILSGLNLIRDVKILQRSAPILLLFWSIRSHTRTWRTVRDSGDTEARGATRKP